MLWRRRKKYSCLKNRQLWSIEERRGEERRGEERRGEERRGEGFFISKSNTLRPDSKIFEPAA
jgi:hypothetical protein